MQPEPDHEPATANIQKGDRVIFFNHLLSANAEGEVVKIQPDSANPVAIKDKDGVVYRRKFHEVTEIR